MAYDLRLPKVNTDRGSPFGRANYNTCMFAPVKVHLTRVPFVDGAYDRGGAYWGSPANLWCAEFQFYNELEQKEHEGMCFVRASSREEAKHQVRKSRGWENVKFYK